MEALRLRLRETAIKAYASGIYVKVAGGRSFVINHALEEPEVQRLSERERFEAKMDAYTSALCDRMSGRGIGVEGKELANAIEQYKRAFKEEGIDEAGGKEAVLRAYKQYVMRTDRRFYNEKRTQDILNAYSITPQEIATAESQAYVEGLAVLARGGDIRGYQDALLQLAKRHGDSEVEELAQLIRLSGMVRGDINYLSAEAFLQRAVRQT